MKIDLHVHTKWSEDAINSPEWMMRILKKRGLDGLAVTDHNTTRSWKPTQEAAKKHSLQLVLGEEIKVYDNEKLSGEVLALFLNEEIKKGDPMEVIDQIRQQDGVVAISHPFDSTKGFRDIERFLPKIDAIESFNARLLSPIPNKIARVFAARKGLGMTGGSDAHIPMEVGMGYTVAEVSDLEEFRKALRKGKTSCGGSMIPFVLNLSGKGLLSLKKVCCAL